MAELKWVSQTKRIFFSFAPDSTLDLYEADPTTAASLFRAWAASDMWEPR